MNGLADSSIKQRLDLFLFRTRFFKTRSAAGKAISSRGVRIHRDGQTRRIDKPSAQVEVGDDISFTQQRDIVTLTIMALPDRRGPASEAQTCYALEKRTTVREHQGQ